MSDNFSTGRSGGPTGGAMPPDEAVTEVRSAVESATAAAGAPLTAADVAEIVVRTLGSLRVYVVESDITEAQQAVRTVVESARY